MLLLLEDNSERLERFTETLRAIDPRLPLRAWRDARVMIREVGPLLPFATFLSLDHDLEPEPGAPDPGDGLEIVKFLVSQPVIRPVIIHSSNAERSRWMGGEFDLAGWDHWRVFPLGDDWIETDWRLVVQEIIMRCAAMEPIRRGTTTKSICGGFVVSKELATADAGCSIPPGMPGAGSRRGADRQ